MCTILNIDPTTYFKRTTFLGDPMASGPGAVSVLHIECAGDKPSVIYPVAKIDGVPIRFLELGCTPAVHGNDRRGQRHSKLELEVVALRRGRSQKHQPHALGKLANRFRVG